MAIELCSENPNVNMNIMMMSPRISFSHDLSQSDTVPVEQFLLRSISSSTDFDFCINDNSNHGSSSADELFANGKILPTDVKVNKIKPIPSPQHETQKPISKTTRVTKSSKMASSSETEEHKKSFWRFKRSSSLNCGSGYARSLCPLPPLSRSNSTGSTPNSVKKSASPAKEGVKVTSQKQGSGNFQKPPLRKNGYTTYGGGVRVNPVLNVPPPANLFGLGSIFSGNNKSKTKKK